MGWTLELKNHKAMDSGTWCKEAEREAKNDGGSRWAVVHKRRQHSTAESFVTLPLRLFAEMLADVPQFTGDR